MAEILEELSKKKHHFLAEFGVKNSHPLGLTVSYSNSLGAFRAYYVNKFIDYHANEIAF
jgi:hypothetical protein